MSDPRSFLNFVFDFSIPFGHFFINEIPFTFDELPFGHLWDEELCRVADANRTYNPEYMYKMYGYLMMEELHPLYFPVELENPELLPDDLEYLYEQEEST